MKNLFQWKALHQQKAFTSAESFGLDWETETVAVQFANGVSALIAYNPNATQDPYNNQFTATSKSMAILYDVSGNKNPNTNGKDIGKINVEQLAGVTGCMIPELKDTMCITQILGPQNGGYSPLTKAECEEIADQGYGNNKAKCGYYENDYWAGAVKECGGVQNMPTQAQLEQLAAYIYPDADSINGGTSITNANWDADRASLFMAQSPGNYFFVWSGQEISQSGAYLRNFDPTFTYWGSSNRRASSNRLAVCLDQ